MWSIIEWMALSVLSIASAAFLGAFSLASSIKSSNIVFRFATMSTPLLLVVVAKNIVGRLLLFVTYIRETLSESKKKETKPHGRF